MTNHANQADTRRSINVGLTFVHRLRRWTNVNPPLIQRLVPSGNEMRTLDKEERRHRQSKGYEANHQTTDQRCTNCVGVLTSQPLDQPSDKVVSTSFRSEIIAQDSLNVGILISPSTFSRLS